MDYIRPVAPGRNVLQTRVYTQLAGGTTLDEAVTRARRRLRQEKYPDWANYILYGDGHFQLVKENA